MAGIKQIDRDSALGGSGQDEWLLKALDTHLTGTFSANRPNVFYPSQLGNKCNRFLFLAYNGLLIPAPLPAKTQRIFDAGGSLEERMDKYFTDMGILEGREKVVKCELPPISGRADFLIRHGENGTIIIELKSINSNNFGRLKTSPKPEHELQIQIYLNLLNIENGVVLYENKNDQTLKAFKVTKSVPYWDKVVDRCLKIMGMVECPPKCTGNRWCPCKEVTI